MKKKWISVLESYPENGQKVEVKRNGKILRCIFVDSEYFRSWKFLKPGLEDTTRPTHWRPI